MLLTEFQVNLPFSSGEAKKKIDFQDGHCGGHLGFPIFAIFDLKVTQMHPTKFQVNWPFGSGEEANNRFSKLPPLLHWISNWNNFTYF